VSDLVRRHPLMSYFVIAYVGTWSAWAFFVLSREGSGLLPFHSPASFLVAIGIGTFSGPAVSAFVVTSVSDGRDGVARLLRRTVQWRVGLAWYVFTFIGLPAGLRASSPAEAPRSRGGKPDPRRPGYPTKRD
jgi:CAAX protease family protein